MITFQKVGMKYRGGPDILHDVTFQLPQGSFHFMTGASGAGKSSLLKLMYLAHRPSRGLIQMFNHDVTSLPHDRLPDLRCKIGVVFQNFRLLDHLSAFDNVALPLRVSGTSEAVVQEHVTELLRWVGLSNKMAARPSTLSGGQQQRVAIARAVINRPRLLLADEPTGSVDDKMGFRLLNLFEELNKLGTTVVIATHSETLVQNSLHPRLHLENGKLHYMPATGTTYAQEDIHDPSL